MAASTELLVSELVTNAVKATAGNNDQAAICLQLSGDNARVLIEVWDADPQPPVPKDLGEDGTPDPQEEGGRGLFLVAALSTRWAWYLTEKPTGKVVWCELSAEPSELSESARSAPQALLPLKPWRDRVHVWVDHRLTALPYHPGMIDAKPLNEHPACVGIKNYSARRG